MARFDVFENPSSRSRAAIPLLLVVQHDRASETASVVVVGLAPLAKAQAMAKSRLYPVVRVAARDYVLLTPNLAAVPRNQLQKHVANVGKDDRQIINAIDMLFTGV
jgi:toxin CcdB